MPTLTSLSGARRSNALKGARRPGRIGLLSLLAGLALAGWLWGSGLPARATAPTTTGPAHDQPANLTSHTGNNSSISAAGPTQPYQLYAWGYNYYGQLGNGTTSDNNPNPTPVVANLPAGVTPTATAGGYSHSLAIGSDGKLYAWGYNNFGQLGNGSTTDSSTPVVVSLPAGVTPTSISAGFYHSLAIGSDGKLYAWGYNNFGQLGNGSTTNNPNPTPVVVSLPVGVTPTAIAAGTFHSLAIGSGGNLYAWGYNHYGQLGNGSTTQSSTPVVVSLPAGVTPTSISAGGSHSLAIGSDGKLYAWGYNNFGQLGNGSNSDSNTPVVVSLPAGVNPTAIAGGYSHSLAIGSGGNLYAWGYNNFGQLGNNTNTDSNTPVVVSLPASVTPSAIAGGYYHSLASGSDGKLYAWGYNHYGQLGNGTTSGSNSPVVVSLPAGVNPTAIAGGFLHSLAIGSGGKLYAWGVNNYGQLGNGTTSDSTPNPNPVVVSLPPGANPTRVAAGYSHSLALVIPPPQLGVSSGNPQSAPVGTAFTAPLVAIVRDGGTNSPLAGITITFSAPGAGASGTFAGGSSSYTGTTDASGQVTTTIFTANRVAGGYNVTASLSGVAISTSFTLTNLAGPAASVTAVGGGGQSATVNTAFTNPLVVSVTDQYSNPVSGTTVTFTAPAGGAGGSFAGGSTVYTGPTDASGLVTTTTFTANTVASSYTVTVTVGGVTTPATFGLTNLAGPAANVTAVGGGGQSATVNTAFSSSLVVSVTDQYANPVSGTLVTFAVPANGASAAFAGGSTTALTGPNGQATSPGLTANSVAGAYNVTATVSGVATPATFALTNLAGVASGLAIVTGDNQQTVISTTFGSSLVAKVTDGSGNPVSGVSVVFTAPTSGASATFGGSASAVYTGTTNAAGLVTSTIPAANSTAGSYTVNAQIVPGTYPARALRSGGNPRVTSVQYHLTNLVGAPASISVLSGSGQSAVVSTTFGTLLVAKVLDSGNNLVSGAVVTFTAPASGASGAFAGNSSVYTGTTSVSGIVTSTAFTANAITGVYTLTARVGGVSSPANFSLTNLTACNPRLVTSTLDDGSCGTLRQAVAFASTSPTKTVTISLTAGSVISLTTGLTLTNGVSITTTASCGVGPNNTLLPPVTLKGVGTSSGNGLTLAANNRLYGLWVRGFSGLQIRPETRYVLK